MTVTDSNYTSANSSKFIFEMGDDLYRDCKVHRKKANRPLVRFARYTQICNYEFNLEFSKRKKDQCHICEYNKILAEKKKREINRTSVPSHKKISEKENDK